MGRLVVSVSRHYTCVIDGVIHDLADISRNGTEVRVRNMASTLKTNPRLLRRLPGALHGALFITTKPAQLGHSNE